ncbi:acyltransferase [Lactiplantibacillus paraplantarum]|uniref:acyltransferase n=1 Tax=Lactiplantibacillus paraplantarum TaxID=60520 RepID=UPI003DA4AA4C
MGNTKRFYYLDCIKIFAIIFVVFNHTNAKGFFLFSQQINSPLFYFYLLISIVCKVAVPLLFMVSGALLLGKKESVKVLWKKRILRCVGIIIAFSFIRYLFELQYYNNWNSFTVLGFFRYIYAAPIEIPYWLLYTYLAALIMMPFLRTLATGLSNQEFKYLIYLQLILTGILPIVQYVLRMGAVNLSIPFVSYSAIFYMLLGYYLHVRRPDISFNKSIVRVVWGLAVLGLIVTIAMVMYQYHFTQLLTEQSSQTFFMSFTVLLAGAVFLSYQNYEQKLKLKKKHLFIDFIAPTILGVYLLEEMYRILMMPLFTWLSPILGSFIACWIWVFAVIILAVFTTNIARLIPLVKKYL